MNSDPTISASVAAKVQAASMKMRADLDARKASGKPPLFIVERDSIAMYPDAGSTGSPERRQAAMDTMLADYWSLMAHARDDVPPLTLHFGDVFHTGRDEARLGIGKSWFNPNGVPVLDVDKALRPVDLPEWARTHDLP